MDLVTSLSVPVGFEAVAAVTMKSTIFRDVTPCSKKFVEVSERHTAYIVRV
jgi:hypothetical protein